jgi:hypothetical protein
MVHAPVLKSHMFIMPFVGAFIPMLSVPVWLRGRVIMRNSFFS